MKPFTDPVFLVETAMLASLLTVGFYTSYTDLKTRKVFNRYTLALLGIGLAGQAAMVALDVTTFGRVAALLGIGLAVAAGLTLFGFWAPGDAKLFLAAVAALPPSLCPSPELLAPQATPVALVLNTLICYLLVLLLVPLWRREPEEEGGSPAHHPRPGGEALAARRLGPGRTAGPGPGLRLAGAGTPAQLPRGPGRSRDRRHRRLRR